MRWAKLYKNQFSIVNIDPAGQVRDLQYSFGSNHSVFSFSLSLGCTNSESSSVFSTIDRTDGRQYKQSIDVFNLSSAMFALGQSIDLLWLRMSPQWRSWSIRSEGTFFDLGNAPCMLLIFRASISPWDHILFNSRHVSFLFSIDQCLSVWSKTSHSSQKSSVHEFHP